MDDRPNDDTVPDPTAEPEGGAATGSGPSSDSVGDTDNADNGERVLDADREGDEPGRDAQAQVDRMETHNRGRSATEEAD